MLSGEVPQQRALYLFTRIEWVAHICSRGMHAADEKKSAAAKVRTARAASAMTKRRTFGRLGSRRRWSFFLRVRGGPRFGTISKRTDIHIPIGPFPYKPLKGDIFG